jgi:hypothetical protein
MFIESALPISTLPSSPKCHRSRNKTSPCSSVSLQGALGGDLRGASSLGCYGDSPQGCCVGAGCLGAVWVFSGWERKRVWARAFGSWGNDGLWASRSCGVLEWAASQWDGCSYTG